MRTASRRARRTAGLLLVAATVLWAFLRRRATAVRWVEPPASVPTEPGRPGELPEDVLATDAGLTELPPEEGAAPASPDTVDEARVARELAETPVDVVVVDETVYEEAVAHAAPEPAEEVVPDAAARVPGEPDAVEVPEEVAPDAAAGVPGEPDVTPEPSAEPAGTDLVDPAIDEPTMTMPGGTAAGEDDEDIGTSIPMPTFSEAPTMEIPAVTDDLRAVRGIGPSMERMLHSLGIVSYRQLAMLDGAELERVRAELSDFRNRIEREDWVGQARALHRQKYGRDPS